ncbi:hypothetical protein EZY14_002805 [Kordia sp. TARA_039_SRF]|nr:hypothetical protein EZY14_002805 [Kordia sp. TARA_039_SRF]
METILKHSTELRRATKTDLLVKSGLVKIGHPYYVLNKEGILFGPQMLSHLTDTKKLEADYNNERIFVPVDSCDVHLSYTAIIK